MRAAVPAPSPLLETGAAVCATDISLKALKIAVDNARHLHAEVEFLACDLVSALAPLSFDLVVSNPPYVAESDESGLQREVRDFEPRVALFSGPTGFEIYERLIRDAPRVLRPDGWLIMELGFQSRERVLAMFDHQWRNLDVKPDLSGIPRVLMAQRR
jgi:release factor glutamine methyltransferase